jgi:hypothetical protein
MLQGRRAVAAKIRQEVTLFGQRLVGSGVYLEQQMGTQRLLKVELRIQVDDRAASFVVVSDGRFLWTYRKLGDEAKLTRVDVSEAAAALEKAGKLPLEGEAGILWNLGGICGLLRQLDASFDFTSVQAGFLESPSGRVAVWQLGGQWKPDFLARAFPNQQPDPGKLPEQLPNQVFVTVGQADFFPYAIEYRRRASKGKTPESRPLVTIQLYDVVFDAPVPQSRFQYQPAGMEYEDRTGAVLQTLAK